MFIRIELQKRIEKKRQEVFQLQKELEKAEAYIQALKEVLECLKNESLT